MQMVVMFEGNMGRDLWGENKDKRNKLIYVEWHSQLSRVLSPHAGMAVISVIVAQAWRVRGVALCHLLPGRRLKSTRFVVDSTYKQHRPKVQVHVSSARLGVRGPEILNSHKRPYPRSIQSPLILGLLSYLERLGAVWSGVAGVLWISFVLDIYNKPSNCSATINNNFTP